MSFGLLRKNKNKPGSEAVPAKMTLLGYLVCRLVCCQPGGTPAVGEAAEVPGWQALMATAATGYFPLGLRESARPALVHVSWGHVSQGTQEIQKNNNDSPPLAALPERGERKMFIHCSQEEKTKERQDKN